MRDLAKVVTVNREWDLEGKDKVHGVGFAEIGYEAMVSKDIKAGDLAIFIQEGSLLPPTETWEFLRNLKCWNEEEKAFLIKVKKFKDIKSWGLCLKPSECGLDEKTTRKLRGGDDVTDLLNIRKYEPKEEASPKKQKEFLKFLASHKMTRWIFFLIKKMGKKEEIEFPTFLISKSDETTVQNAPQLFEKCKGKEIVATVKMEGMSATYLWTLKNGKLDKFLACSRNLAYRDNRGGKHWEWAERNGIAQKLKDWFKETGQQLIVQGELCGEGIQNNIYRLDGNELYVYTIKEGISRRQLSYEEMVSVCRDLGLKTVPYIADGKIENLFPSIKECEEWAENLFFKVHSDKTIGFVYHPKEGEKLWKDYSQHEGMVVRTLDCDKDRNIGSSFKVKNIEYAEKGLNFIGNIKWSD